MKLTRQNTPPGLQHVPHTSTFPFSVIFGQFVWVQNDTRPYHVSTLPREEPFTASHRASGFERNAASRICCLGGGPNWSLIIGPGRAHGKSSTRHILSKRREESQILNPNLEKFFSHIVSQSDLLQHGRRLASASIQSVGEPLLHQSKRDSCHLNRCRVTRLQ